ncbi:MAG: molybdopterin oxidoreductase family protein, partial [Alphaproteobacteria bacterium]|nr:molybdopterin oxidoreductase family protein [Alphaproteobacteria bacterium]
AYLDTAHAMGMVGVANQVVFQLYSEHLQKFRLAAEGHGKVQPPDRLRERIRTYFDPLPIWYVPFEQASIELAAYPLHAITQRPMPMYHAWGSQNAWLRQIYSRNYLYANRRMGEALGIADDDWVWVTSRTGRVKCQIRLMEGVNHDTVWTWNAIGKRSGAWNLAADANESEQGFLLNHVISEWLPAQKGQGDNRTANADPVTGQAAWYDLRVRIEKVAHGEEGQTVPHFATLPRPPHMKPATRTLRYGEKTQ